MIRLLRNHRKIILLQVFFIIIFYPVSTRAEVGKIFDLILKMIPTNVGIDTNYTKRHHQVTTDFGAGLEKGKEVTLNDINRELRYAPPHPDDVRWRNNEILEHSNNDNYNNYTISKNKTCTKIADRIYLDIIGFSYHGIINILWRTSSLPYMDEERIEGKNFSEKNYIKPEYPGPAYIYYMIRYKYHDFFSKTSYSFPVYLHFPMLRFDNIDKKTLFYLNGFLGTNILKPEKIQLENEKGWDRWGSLQVYGKKDVGQIIERKYFIGCNIELPIDPSIILKLQYHCILINYQENFSHLMTIDKKNTTTNAFGLKFIINL
jgi:hypothetical protein